MFLITRSYPQKIGVLLGLGLLFVSAFASSFYFDRLDYLFVDLGFVIFLTVVLELHLRLVTHLNHQKNNTQLLLRNLILNLQRQSEAQGELLTQQQKQVLFDISRLPTRKYLDDLQKRLPKNSDLQSLALKLNNLGNEIQKQKVFLEKISGGIEALEIKTAQHGPLVEQLALDIQKIGGDTAQQPSLIKQLLLGAERTQEKTEKQSLVLSSLAESLQKLSDKTERQNPVISSLSTELKSLSRETAQQNPAISNLSTELKSLSEETAQHRSLLEQLAFDSHKMVNRTPIKPTDLQPILSQLELLKKEEQRQKALSDQILGSLRSLQQQNTTNADFKRLLSQLESIEKEGQTHKTLSAQIQTQLQELQKQNITASDLDPLFSRLESIKKEEQSQKMLLEESLQSLIESQENNIQSSDLDPVLEQLESIKTGERLQNRLLEDSFETIIKAQQQNIQSSDLAPLFDQLEFLKQKNQQQTSLSKQIVEKIKQSEEKKFNPLLEKLKKLQETSQSWPTKSDIQTLRDSDQSLQALSQSIHQLSDCYTDTKQNFGELMTQLLALIDVRTIDQKAYKNLEDTVQNLKEENHNFQENVVDALEMIDHHLSSKSNKK